MRPSTWLLCTQLATCLALLASAALWVHHLGSGGSEFCSVGSGCDSVRHSPLASFFETLVPLPVVGVPSFALVLWLSCRVGRPVARSARGASGLPLLWYRPELTLFAAAGIGGVLAAALLAYQALSLGRFCWLCVVVDASALSAAVSAFFLARALRSGRERVAPLLTAPTFWAIAPLLVLGPAGYQWLSPDAPAPEGVAALFQPGKINVIEFADFECPYCRRLHGVLKPVLAEYGDRVHFRRLHRPLPSHPMADLAARAGICAEQAGQGEAMADRLFSIQLSPRSIRSAAAELRLDLDALDACMTSAATDATLREHEALLPDGELQGLPTTFVGGEAIVGAVTPAALRDALDRAAHARPASAAAPAFVGVWAALIALCAYFGRLSAADAERRRSAPDPSAG